MATRQPSRALTISLGGLDLLEQRLEPTERRRVTADPEELYTLEGTERALLLAVPDVLEDGRERRHTDTRADEQHRLVVQEVLRRGPERPVDHDAGEHTVNRRVRSGPDDLAGRGVAHVVGRAGARGAPLAVDV